MQLQQIFPTSLRAMFQADRAPTDMVKMPPPWQNPPASVVAKADTYVALCTARTAMQRPYTGKFLGLPDHLLLRILQATHAHGALSAATACRSLRIFSRDDSLWTRERLASWSPAALGTLPLDIQAKPLVRALRFSARAREMIARPEAFPSDMRLLLTRAFEGYEALSQAAKAIVDASYDALAQFQVTHCWLSECSDYPALMRLWPHPALLERATAIFLRNPKGAYRVNITQENALPVVAGFLGHAPVANNRGNYRIFFFDLDLPARVLEALSVSDDHAALRDKLRFIAQGPLDRANKRHLRAAVAKRPGLRFYAATGDGSVTPLK